MNHNTLGPGPLDPDRIMPEQMFAGGLDENLKTFGATVDFQGAPVAYGFQMAEKVGNWMEAIEAGKGSQELQTEIVDGFAESHAKYPEAPMWDRMRGLVSGSFLQAGQHEAAIEIILTMQSPRHAIDHFENLAKQEDEAGKDTSPLWQSFAQKLEAQAPERQRRLLRVHLDHCIENNPYGLEEQIDKLEAALAVVEPNFDPTQSWANSRKEEGLPVDWDALVAYIKDDAAWADIPLRGRQSIIATYIDLQKSLARTPTKRTANFIAKHIDGYVTMHPEAAVWNHFRHNFANQLTEAKLKNLAKLFRRKGSAEVAPLVSTPLPRIDLRALRNFLMPVKIHTTE